MYKTYYILIYTLVMNNIINVYYIKFKSFTNMKNIQIRYKYYL